MDMTEKAVLTDCLESLKHASTTYLRTSLECDTDGLRQTLSRLAIDKAEESNAVFNLMHQAGIRNTEPSAAEEVSAFLTAAREQLEKIGGPSQRVRRELSGGKARANGNS